MVYRGNIEESVVANSLKTEGPGMIENCLPMTGGGGWVGHKNITDGGGWGHKYYRSVGGGGNQVNIFTTQPKFSKAPPSPLPFPPRQ